METDVALSIRYKYIQQMYDELMEEPDSQPLKQSSTARIWKPPSRSVRNQTMRPQTAVGVRSIDERIRRNQRAQQSGVRRDPHSVRGNGLSQSVRGNGGSENGGSENGGSENGEQSKDLSKVDGMVSKATETDYQTNPGKREVDNRLDKRVFVKPMRSARSDSRSGLIGWEQTENIRSIGSQSSRPASSRSFRSRVSSRKLSSSARSKETRSPKRSKSSLANIPFSQPRPNQKIRKIEIPEPKVSSTFESHQKLNSVQTLRTNLLKYRDPKAPKAEYLNAHVKRTEFTRKTSGKKITYRSHKGFLYDPDRIDRYFKQKQGIKFSQDTRDCHKGPQGFEKERILFPGPDYHIDRAYQLTVQAKNPPRTHFGTSRHPEKDGFRTESPGPGVYWPQMHQILPKSYEAFIPPITSMEKVKPKKPKLFPKGRSVRKTKVKTRKKLEKLQKH